MAQYVIEFGADNLRSIPRAMEKCLVPPYELSVDSADKTFWYTNTGKAFKEVLDDLEAGTVLSVGIQNGDTRVRYGLITSPQCHARSLSLWMGTIEVYVENWTFIWDCLLEEHELQFICVSLEEGVELSNEQIGIKTFPWDDWPLLIGAVHSGSGTGWFIQERALPSSKP